MIIHGTYRLYIENIHETKYMQLFTNVCVILEPWFAHLKQDLTCITTSSPTAGAISLSLRPSDTLILLCSKGNITKEAKYTHNQIWNTCTFMMNISLSIELIWDPYWPCILQTHTQDTHVTWDGESDIVKLVFYERGHALKICTLFSILHYSDKSQISLPLTLSFMLMQDAVCLRKEYRRVTEEFSIWLY